MKDTKYQRFVQLLHEAHAAAKAVDDFDLDSESTKSSLKFAELENAQLLAFFRLVEFCRRHNITEGMVS